MAGLAVLPPLMLLVLGMLHRQRHGVGNMEWESASIVVLYVTSAAALYV